jgi:hypothetical protein
VSKGFVVLAQNTETVDYVKQAYALALSIKNTQKTVTKISLITNDPVPVQYKHVFDKIIEIPWGDLAINPTWKIENRWKIFHVSPYLETIVLDTDMLFLDDISDWWEYCSTSDLKFCSKIKNYKNETITTDTVHRKTFIANNLSNPYVALFYFKKSDLALSFFKILEFVIKNWEFCSKTITSTSPQKWLSIDLATAMAIYIMGIEEQVIDSCSPLEFTHMKPAIQGWSPVPSSWQNVVSFNFENGVMLVGNYRQQFLFHYVEKDFLTDNILVKLEGQKIYE